MNTEDTKKSCESTRSRPTLRSAFRATCQIATTAALIVFLNACATNSGGGLGGIDLFPTESIAEKNVPTLPSHLLLDIGIQELDPNYTVEQAKEGEVFPEVRKAEAKYFALRLRDALNRSDFWGNVWVVPQAAITDIKVGGKIVESTGQSLELEIIAVDATGKTLLNKTYSEEATEYDYSGGRKPFNNTFIDIARDLEEIFDGASHAQATKIKEHADMRFASWIAPDAFSQYANANDEQQEAVSAPRHNPIYQQAVRLREYDQIFFDRLQDDYDTFYNQVEPQHTTWSHESYKEIAARDEAQSEAVMKGVLSGLVMARGIAVMAAGANSDHSGTQDAAILGGGAVAAAGGAGVYSAVGEYQRTAIHDDAVAELSRSLEGDLKPHVIEIEGKTIQLEGSIEEQYLQWHAVLQEQHRLEAQADY